MRRIPVAIVTLVGSLVVAACSGRDTTAPRGIAPDQANYAVATGYAATCDKNAISTAAKNAFTSNQDSAYSYDIALAKAYNGGLDGSATGVVWQIGRLVATERLKSATTNSSALAVYLVDVLRCASDLSAPKNPSTNKYPALFLPSKFLENAPTILQSGIWEVRGGTTNSQFPAAGRVIDDTTQVRAFGLPRWGAEAVGGTWPGTLEYGVYGYPLNFGLVVVGSAGNINTNEIEKNSFELGTLPDSTPKTGIRVGVCISPDVNTGVVNRIVHNGTQILANSTLSDLCDYSNTSFQASAPVSASWYATVLQRAGSFLAPKDLFAQGFTDCSDCIGGLPSGWSPFSPGAITAANIVLTITGQPKNTVVSATANDTVVVRATINGTPVPDVLVDSLSVYNNSGTPAGAIITDHSHPYTDGDGFATVTFSVGKAGGYLITLYGRLDGNLTQSVTTQQFQVKNQ